MGRKQSRIPSADEIEGCLSGRIKRTVFGFILCDQEQIASMVHKLINNDPRAIKVREVVSAYLSQNDKVKVESGT